MSSKSFSWIGRVGDPSFWDYFGGSGSTISTAKAEAVVEHLSLSNNNTAHIILSSNGGDVFTAIRINDMLSPYKSKIDVELVGLAASAGSFVAMGISNRLFARESSMMMIHGPLTVTYGGVREHNNAVQSLTKVTATLKKIYNDNSKLSTKEIDEALDNELWLTSDEMVSNGIAAKILKPNEGTAANPHSEEVDEIMETLIGEDTEASKERLVNSYPIDKIAALYTGVDFKIAAEHKPSNDKPSNDKTESTEVVMADENKEVDSLKAEVGALKDKIVNLEKTNADLKASLDDKDKQLKDNVNNLIIDNAISSGVLKESDREVWLDRLDKGGEVVKGILADMEPNPLFKEQGTSNESETVIGNIPHQIVSSYKQAGFKDDEILAAWKEEGN